MQKSNLTIYCDGGSRGNPGPAASAFVALDDNKVIHKESKYLGIETNNVAEYAAVLFAVNWLIEQYPISNIQYPIIINLDSQLVERQLNGFYKIKNEKLKKLADEIKLKIDNEVDRVNWKSVTGKPLKIIFKWEYRDKNKLADSLVNDELDEIQLRYKNTSR